MKKNFIFISGIALTLMIGNLFIFAAENIESPGAAQHPPRKSSSESLYVLKAGDRVSIKIYPEDKYIKGAEMPISSEGDVSLPLAGKIQIAGLTVSEAQKKIVQLLDADYLVNPEVVIEILEYKDQSIVILGQVKKPGTYQFPPGETHLTLLQAISMAGGFSDIANVKKIKIVRKAKAEGSSQAILQANAEAIISGKDPDIELVAGDVIHVSESLF